MAIFPIRTFPDPVLRTAAEDVTEFDDTLKRLVDGMFETMYDAPGVGLAAPQIGISRRVFVADVGEGPIAMCNPKIVATDGKWKFEEGCLSVPGKYWQISRAEYVRAAGLDVAGDIVEYEGDDLLGRVLQHEIDHLDGMLLLERLPRRMRRAALKELRDEALDVHRPA